MGSYLPKVTWGSPCGWFVSTVCYPGQSLGLEIILPPFLLGHPSMLMPNFLPNSRRSFNIYNYLVFHLGSQKLISVDLEVDIDSYFLSSIWHLLRRLPLLLLRNSSLLLASLCAGIVSFLFFFFPLLLLPVLLRYSWHMASLVAQSIKSLPAMRETRVQSQGGKIPWRRKWQPIPVFLPGETHGEEPGGLHSMGSHRVGHDCVTNSLFHFDMWHCTA